MILTCPTIHERQINSRREKPVAIVHLCASLCSPTVPGFHEVQYSVYSICAHLTHKNDIAICDVWYRLCNLVPNPSAARLTTREYYWEHQGKITV